MALVGKTALLRLFPLFRRFVPIVGRGLALGFAVLAVATAFFGMGDYPSLGDRWLVAAVYALIALASLGIALSVKPILRFVLRLL